MLTPPASIPVGIDAQTVEGQIACYARAVVEDRILDLLTGRDQRNLMVLVVTRVAENRVETC
jgi:hypothetical protein